MKITIAAKAASCVIRRALCLLALAAVAILSLALLSTPAAAAEARKPLGVVPAVKSVEAIAANQFEIVWAWTVREQPSKDWTVFVHFVDDKGQPAGGGDFDPELPTSSWKPGTTVLTTNLASVAEGTSSTIDIRVGLYRDSERAWLDCPADAELRVLAGRLQIKDDKATFIAPKKDNAVVAAEPSVKSVESVSRNQFRITWQWAVREQPNEDWRAFVHFVDDKGEVKFNGDYNPVPPTSSWKPGTIVLPPTVVTVLGGVSGTFEIRAGLYQQLTVGGERAQIGGSADAERRVLAGKLKIENGKAEFIPQETPKKTP